MFKFLYIALFLIALSLNAQEKKTYYFDNKSNQITKKEFIKSLNNRDYLFQTFEIDTAFISVRFKRKNTGQLNENEFNTLKTSLNDITKKELNDEKFILIHYYPGATPCLKSIYPSLWNNDDSGYLNQLNNITSINVYFVFRNDDTLDDSYTNKFVWLKDKKQTIEKQFFKYIFPCGSFVVISDTGEYISYYGEYGKHSVLDFTKELSKKIKKRKKN